jgi:hypothetical protein
MTAFSLLPTELVEEIVSYLDQADLNTVCRLNKGLHGLAIPFLYRHVDLRISSGSKPPRVDRFCLNIVDDIRLARRVETLHIGPSSSEEVNNSLRSLSYDASFDHFVMFKKAINALSSEHLVSDQDDRIPVLDHDSFRYAIHGREYTTYTILVLLLLPSLRELRFADYHFSVMDRLFSVLRINQRRKYPVLPHRMSSIKTVAYNFDKKSGLRCLNDYRDIDISSILYLPDLRILEFSIARMQARSLRARLTDLVRASNITVLAIRHSNLFPDCILPLLNRTPQLESLT